MPSPQSQKYTDLIRSFLDGRMSAQEFEATYLAMFAAEPAFLPEGEFLILDKLFADVEAFVSDTTLIGPNDLDEQQLRAESEEACVCSSLSLWPLPVAARPAARRIVWSVVLGATIVAFAGFVVSESLFPLRHNKEDQGQELNSRLFLGVYMAAGVIEGAVIGVRYRTRPPENSSAAQEHPR